MINTKHLLNCLLANSLAKDSILYVYCDGPKKNASKIELEKINAVRDFIKSENWCKETYVIEAEANLGCAPSIVKGVTEVIKQHGKVIVIEDDLILSPFFLEFMNDALNLYENHPKVSSIGACNFFANGDKFPKSFFLPYPDCLGWATWAYRWDAYEYDAEKLLSELREKKLIKKFNSNGAFDMEGLLIAQINKAVSAWDVQWTATCVLNDWLTLYPNESISQHIFIEDATHSAFNISPPLLQEKIVLQKQEVKINPKVFRAMRWGYNKKGDFYGKKLPVKPDKVYFKKITSHYRNSSKKWLRKVLKKIIPKAAVTIGRRMLASSRKFEWFTLYPSWNVALRAAEGYDSNIILNSCKAAIEKVRDGEAVYERDSVLFEEVEYSWGLLAGLQRAALDNNTQLCVLDFGGSLGTSYYQNRAFLNNIPNLQWCIIEQENFVKEGKQNFENENLKFYYSIEECLQIHKPNVVLLSSVLQYLEKPYELVKEIFSVDSQYIIIDRTAFTNAENPIICLQNVPAYIYKASYPCHFFTRDSFLKQFKEKYKVLAEFDSGFTQPQKVGNIEVYWNGFILKK